MPNENPDNQVLNPDGIATPLFHNTLLSNLQGEYLVAVADPLTEPGRPAVIDVQQLNIWLQEMQKACQVFSLDPKVEKNMQQVFYKCFKNLLPLFFVVPNCS